MAYLVKRAGDQVEIRESHVTRNGPRSRQLARFTGALTPALLARAAARAKRPFDAEALLRRARVLGIPVATRAPEREARALLGRLRRGDALDPLMAELLTRALVGVPRAAVPEPLAEVAEWVGASATERGAALRDLLDAYGRIVASRPPVRERPQAPFPRFSSAARKKAS